MRAAIARGHPLGLRLGLAEGEGFAGWRTLALFYVRDRCLEIPLVEHMPVAAPFRPPPLSVWDTTGLERACAPRLELLHHVVGRPLRRADDDVHVLLPALHGMEQPAASIAMPLDGGLNRRSLADRELQWMFGKPPCGCGLYAPVGSTKLPVMIDPSAGVAGQP
jgi:hypothetical protein